jgi:hypothetical protein
MVLQNLTADQIAVWGTHHAAALYLDYMKGEWIYIWHQALAILGLG